MRYLSVCSGIEAATAAWHPLGWKPAAFSEIEAFPRAVLKHHYPDVPLHGDFTTIEADQYGPIDLLVGGTPCQSFSIAGLRGGLDDERGNLALEFLKLAQRTRPRWVVWENVPGVLSSNGGRDFGSILGGLVELGYGFAYRVLDAQFFGLAQRRRRVFVVGHLGDWRRAAAVLFERDCLSGNSAPRREKGEEVAGVSGAGIDGGGWPAEVAPTLNAHFGEKLGLENQHINGGAGLFVPMAFSAKDYGADASVNLSLTLRAGGSTTGHANGGVMPAVAYPIDTMNHIGRGDGHSLGDFVEGAPSFTLTKGHSHAVATHSAVRRLTPIECERLQGFPDNFTRIPWRNRSADDCPDGPRYKALGNSMAVPVMAWIGKRIQMVEEIA